MIHNQNCTPRVLPQSGSTVRMRSMSKPMPTSTCLQTGSCMGGDAAQLTTSKGGAVARCC